eukprot:TRINITY_DN8270_c0_g1_i2.p1 TRINITY_DN8270_c0_g1~~TRINITY_DN8270_c0_g1_i2.p1  ORF type:complete len:197 (+),score=25.13 TRINITY_DN8270_c0_g1_i2:56-592(+)
MPRILIRGPAGAGKSTLANNISEILGIPHIEMDALHHEEGFVPSPHFLDRVKHNVGKESWVMDGNYSKSHHLTDPVSTHVIWLDLPLYFVLWSVLCRSLYRIWSGELLWGTCKESIWNLLHPSDRSILWFTYFHFDVWKKSYETAYPIWKSEGKAVYRLKSRAEINKFVENLRKTKEI